MQATLAPGLSLDCLPRWGTPRDLTRRTRGPEVARIATALGTPSLMPWQQHVADVALEVDDGGLLVYGEVVLTVPRQSGKTTLLLALMVHRALAFESAQRIIYTAQTRNDARRKWEDEHVRLLERSPLASIMQVRKALGFESILWTNGSNHSISSSTEKAGHGETLDLGVVDEAFAHEDARLEQALKPTMITRPQPQLWVVSTAGSPKSHYLRSKVDAGRLQVELGQPSTVAYFEWSAPPDAPPQDPATWRSCMPALGHTIAERAVANHAATMPVTEFRRAYLNQWPDEAATGWTVIAEHAWTSLADHRSTPVDPVSFALDVTPDRSRSAVAVAGGRSDGRLHVEVVEHNAGTTWVVGRLQDLVAKWNPCAVVLDAAGPAGTLLPALQAAGIEAITPSTREVAQATGMFYDAVLQGGLAHLDQPSLKAALAGAQQRPLGDAWAWARKGSAVDISPLVAVTLAGWGHATRAHVAADPQPFFAAWR